MERIPKEFLGAASDAPAPTGVPPKVVSLIGKIIPWTAEQPVLLSMPASPYRYLPCFTDPDKLHAFMQEAKIGVERVKKIDEQHDFLDSLPLDVRVVLDPYFLPNGRVRFLQVATRKET